MVTNINNHENAYIPYSTACSEDFEGVFVGRLIRVTFREFVTLQRGFDLPKKNIKAGVYPVVGSTSVIGYHAEFKANPPGVVIGRSGSLGRVLYVSDKYWPHNTSLWVRDFKGNIPKYVYYFLQTLELQRYDSGAAVPTLNRNHLDSLELRIHNLPTQCKIAAILSNYDDLIENNTRRIEILEEMAGTIYREWFVEFRFPGHENAKVVESELGLIPQGWEVGKLGDLAESVRRNIKPSDVDQETPYFGLEHLPRKSIALSHWDTVDSINSTKLAFKKGEILFGKIRPYFHKVGIAPLDGICSSDTIVIRAKRDEFFAIVLACVTSERFVEVATVTSQGTKMPRANWDVLTEYPIVLPSSQLFERFNSLIQGIIEMIDNLIFRNINLRESRDLLLPKLISGELDVSDLNTNTDTVQSNAGNCASSNSVIE